jgi:hypothetical protein
MTYDKRDKNERAIVEFWERAGCVWIAQSRYAGFDGLLLSRGEVYFVEIKQPSERNRLTENEKRTKENIEYHGDKYNIITSIEEAAALIFMEVTA